MATTIEIFFCYAHEDQPLLQKLRSHLMPLQWQGLITIWSDTNINAGAEWEQEINKHLNTAHIILLLVSSDFMASEYCYSKEMKRALERHEHGEARVIPILLRPTYWKGAPFDKLQVLPTNAKPVTDQSWHTEDNALYDVAEQISIMVKDLRIQAILKDASELFRSLRYEEALMLYDQAIILEPVQAPAYVGKGETLLVLGRNEESLKAFDQAVQADPSSNNTHLLHNRAVALHHLKRDKECLAAYNEALHLSPHSIDLHKEKAQLLFDLGEYTKALEVYDQLITLQPNKAEYHQSKGDLLLLLHRQHEALKIFEQAIRLRPKSPSSYHKKADLLFLLGEYDEALDAYEQALRLEPGHVRSLRNKARTLLILNRYKKALAAYEQYLSQGIKEDAPYFFERGQALFGLERYEEALAAYESAIQLDKSSPQFYQEKGRVHELLAQIAYSHAKKVSLTRKPTKNDDSSFIQITSPGDYTLSHTPYSAYTVHALAFSQDGKLLASGSGDHFIYLWDPQSAQKQETLAGGGFQIFALAFSPDGKLLASGSGDKTIKLWRN